MKNIKHWILSTSAPLSDNVGWIKPTDEGYDLLLKNNKGEYASLTSDNKKEEPQENIVRLYVEPTADFSINDEYIEIEGAESVQILDYKDVHSLELGEGIIDVQFIGDEPFIFHYLNVGNIEKKLDLSNVDISQMSDIHETFNLSSVHNGLEYLQPINNTNLQGVFSSLEGDTLILPAQWCTSKVTNLRGTFSYCSFNYISGIEYWNTSNVTTMEDIFYNSHFSKVLNLWWDTSNVKNLRGAFMNATFPGLDLNTWDTSNVTDLTDIFKDLCLKDDDMSLILIDWGKWEGNLTLDLSTISTGYGTGSFDHFSWKSMLLMYDRKANGLGDSTIIFNKSANFPDGFVDKMVAKGYTIVLK